ncbi:hypothetical protein [Neptunomonas phycophila]|jgi:hypothetical protein|uniref:hypothetical protein n=1 Tax=Neptunomonas phycophila TaxID=1572645 RepID=UPI0035189207
MKDQHDKNTIDISELLAVPKKKGAKPKYGTAMTPAMKMALMREKIRLAIDNRQPSVWDERTCIEAMSNTKYIARRRDAWMRYGSLNGFIDTNTPDNKGLYDD